MAEATTGAIAQPLREQPLKVEIGVGSDLARFPGLQLTDSAKRELLVSLRGGYHFLLEEGGYNKRGITEEEGKRVIEKYSLPKSAFRAGIQYSFEVKQGPSNPDGLKEAFYWGWYDPQKASDQLDELSRNEFF